jgi:hypothetical protein
MGSGSDFFAFRLIDNEEQLNLGAARARFPLC